MSDNANKCELLMQIEALRAQVEVLTADFVKQLDELSQANYKYRFENNELKAQVEQLQSELDELCRDKVTVEYELRAYKESDTLLKAQVNTLRAAIKGAIDKWEGVRELEATLYVLMRFYNKTSDQCLAEVRAQAVIDAINAHKNKVMTFGFDTAIRVNDLIRYANQLRQAAKGEL